MCFDVCFFFIFGRFAAATPHFYMPGAREAAIFGGANDASKSVLEKILSKTKDSLYIWTGGTKELLLTNPNSNKTYLVINDRKGFIKIAIRNGVDIIPCMQFGEKYFYHRYKYNYNLIPKLS